MYRNCSVIPMSVHDEYLRTRYKGVKEVFGKASRWTYMMRFPLRKSHKEKTRENTSKNNKGKRENLVISSAYGQAVEYILVGYTAICESLFVPI